MVACERHDYQPATRLEQESLRRNRQPGDVRGMAICLDGLAAVALPRGDMPLAARLLGAAAQLVALRSFALSEGAGPVRTLAEARARLGDAAFEEHWTAGRTLSLDQ